MDNESHSQIFNLIEKSQNILLLTHAKADCDGLGSMISMYLALKQLGKNVTAATNDPTPDVLNFLPSIGIVQNSLFSSDFVIQLNIQKTPLKTIKYKLAEDHSKVNIIITPKTGNFKPEDISFGKDEWNFDLIITFDTGNLEHLGPIYEQNAELFFKTPLINIDHHASNNDYGQVNMVDLVAASTTEVLMDLLEAMEKKYEKTFISEDVATLLLAGLITDTGSFQHANTSPRAMEVAATLLEKGARQQEIIKNIYKTKKLSTLKLWGTVLSKVQTDPIYRLVWSSISQNDLKETGANADESEGIIDDLLSNAPGAEIIMLFKYNEDGYVSASMRSTTNSADVGKLSTEMGGGGHIRAAGFKRRDGSSLEKLIEDTLQKTREYQGNRLNIHPENAQNIVQVPKEKEKLNSATQKQQSISQSVQPTQKKSKPNPETTQYLDFKAPQQSLKSNTEPAKNLNKNNKDPQQKTPPESHPKKDLKTLTRDFTSKNHTQSQNSAPKPIAPTTQSSQKPQSEAEFKSNPHSKEQGQIENKPPKEIQPKQDKSLIKPNQTEDKHNEEIPPAPMSY